MESEKIRLKISTGELRKVVTLAGNAVPSNAIVPAYEYLLVRVLEQGKMIELTGTDSGMSISTKAECISIEVEDFDDVTFMVPFNMLSALLKTLPEAPLELIYYKDELDGSHATVLYSYSIKVIVEGQEYEMAGEDPISFTKPSIEGGKDFVISAFNLKEGLRYTKDNTSVNNELYPILDGVFVDANPEFVTFVSTDRFRGGVFASKQPGGAGLSFVMPQKMFNFLFNQIPDTYDEDIKITISDKTATVETEYFTMISSLLEGKYADYTRLILGSHDINSSIQVDDWKSVLRRSILFADPLLSESVHSFREDKCYIDSMNDKVNSKSEQHTLLQDPVDKISINLNAKYLLTLLSPIKGFAKIGLSNSSHPIYIYPLTHTGESLTLFLLPTRLPEKYL